MQDETSGRLSSTTGSGRVAHVWVGPFGRVLLVLSGALVVVSTFVYPNITDRMPFPPGLDQDWYLEAGQQFAEGGAFMWRAPLYSAWLGSIYKLTRGDLHACYVVDKTLSTLALSILTGWLVWRVLGVGFAIAAATWILNLKYLITETNGSHTFAAIWIVLGCILLTHSRSDAARPWALFSLFLAACCRRDLLLPLAIVGVFVGVSARQRRSTVRTWRSRGWVRTRLHWVVCALLGVLLLGLFRSNVSQREPSHYTTAFAQTFCVNYVERHGLLGQYPDKWMAFERLMPEQFPGVSSHAQMAIHHPRELVAHVAYNARLAARAIPANVLAFERPGLMLVVLLALTLVEMRREALTSRRSAWARIPSQHRPMLIALTVSLHVIVPVCLLFRVAARYLIPLIAVQVFWGFLAIDLQMRRWFRQRRAGW